MNTTDESRSDAATAGPLKYWVELPPGIGKDVGRKWPTLIFLHGAGQRGVDPAELATYEGVCLANKFKPDTFIVFAPVCPVDTWWPPAALEDLVRTILAEYPVDEDRLYLTGMSMGGYGCWAMAAEYPELFAAIVPLCGGGDPRKAARFKDVPIWAFQGAKDDLVPAERSREMVEALRRIGGRVRYTEFPDADHNCWTPAYTRPELYDWLLQQVRGNAGNGTRALPG
jgi:predicted peptidase